MKTNSSAIPTGKVKIEVETKYDSKERTAPATLTLTVNGEQWAREGYQIANDWAYDVEVVSDPAKDQTSDQLIANMMNFVLNGISPVAEAPEVPAEYWQKLQLTAEQRITLAGYRIADIIIASADNIEAQRKFVGR